MFKISLMFYLVGDTALEVFEKLRQILDAMIIGDIFDVGSSKFSIEKNMMDEEGTYAYRQKQRYLIYSLGDYESGSIMIKLYFESGFPTKLEVYQTIINTLSRLYFPFDEVYLDHNLEYVFREWIRIATSNNSFKERVAMRDSFIENYIHFNSRIAGIMAVVRHDQDIANPELASNHPPALEFVSRVFSDPNLIKEIHNKGY